MPEPADMQWKEVALYILQRNGAVTLSPYSMEDDNYTDELCFGSRLLDMTDSHLVVEVPSASECSKCFEADSPIYVVMVHRTHRMELCSKVIERIKFQINANIQTIAYQLSLPTHVGSAQRRAYYRAHVSAMSIKPVKFTPLDPVLKHPIHSLAFEAHMVNISGGGMGVIIKKKQVPLLKDYAFFECELHLPMHDEQLKYELHCKSMHSTAGRKGDVYVGMEFQITDANHKREVIDKLVHYTAWVQREQLRNERQKR